MTYSELFSKEEVNTGRQWAFDFAKFIAIVGMVLVHTFIYIWDEDGLDEGFQYRLNNIYGGVLAAPVFMFAMGVGVAYSRNTSAATMLQRGIKLLVAGALLNAVRCLPQLLLWKTGYGPQHYDWFIEEVYLFDILPFAGVAFLLFALLRRLKASPTAVLLTGVALSVFGTFVRSVDMGSTALNLLCYPFIGIHVGAVWSSFPLANWFIFVAAGYWFGRLIRRCTDPNYLYALLSPVAGFLFAVCMIYLTTRQEGMFSDANDDYFYYLTPFDAFVCIMGAVMVAGIGHFLMPHEPKVVQHEVRQVATDVTRIYLIHWVFVCYLVGGLLDGVLDIYPADPLLLLVGMAILYASAWLARREPFTRIKI
ncbi:MAG: DUF1624 domain-containing protein [Prevotella sp.]|nr:DUF1624 domain-containing protein [Prevotella sp.]